MDLALFDFDGTITVSDTFLPFIRFSVHPMRQRLGAAALSPMIAGYKLGLVRATTMRASVVKVGLAGRRQSDIDDLGLRYSQETLPHVVRTEALERIRWHQQRSDAVVVVSASLDVYLRHWCEKLGVARISTELEMVGGVLTGRYERGDCTGAEKARRVLEQYDLNDYSTVYAYGDTREDEQLLNLANRRYLRWREL